MQTTISLQVKPSEAANEQILREYIARFRGIYARVKGFAVFESPGEVPCDFERGTSILAIRHTWARDGRYDKPLLTTLPITFTPGFHESEPSPSIDEDLWMLHIQKACKSYVFERAMWKARQKNFREDEVKKHWGEQQHLTPDTFESWWNEDWHREKMHIPPSLADPPVF